MDPFQTTRSALIAFTHRLLGFSDIAPEILAKRRIFEIIDTVQTENPNIFATKPAFDGKKNIFSFKPLFPGGGMVFPCKPEGSIKEFTVTIRLVAQVESEYLSPVRDPFLLLIQWLLGLSRNSLVGAPPRLLSMCQISSRFSYHSTQTCKYWFSEHSL